MTSASEKEALGEADWPSSPTHLEDGELPEPSSKRLRTEALVEKPDCAMERPEAACTHEVVLPPDSSNGGLESPFTIPQHFDAFHYPFALDEFQKIALAAIERSESVLVSAHTSAGKTVVALYAIARSLKKGQRVVYTSPIKALSNQKYRELFAAFGGDVGLMTGDVNVNVDASCLVMTTEILRNMLYRGHELIREVQWVIFDEVHYMRDKERGVIWEECIILLPRAVRFVFLSATVPNGREFAQWVAATHGFPCHLISTPHRPTPLEHWAFPLGGDGLHLLVDDSGRFLSAGYDGACRSLAVAGEHRAAAGRGGVRGAPELLRLLRLLIQRDLSPAIIFSFSRKECEGAAMSAKTLEALPEDKRQAVRLVFDAAIATLSDDDQQIPQVGMLLPMLERGVAVHHSGMLPVLRDVVEILFQEGLVRLLFATETFSMGVNMPARTVIFTSLRKWDGDTFRPPSSAEYIQMSGRAGRRGLDARGMVVLLMTEAIEESDLRDMMRGDPLPLTSSFRLRYNTLLRLYSMESLQPESLIRQSFYAFQRSSGIPALEAKAARLVKTAEALRQPDDARLTDLVTLRKSRASLVTRANEIALHPKYSVRFLQPGRLARVVDGAADFGWGVVLGFRHVHNRLMTSAIVLQASSEEILVDVLLACAPTVQESGEPPAADRTLSALPAALSDPGADPQVHTVSLRTLTRLSAARLWLPTDLRPLGSRRIVLEGLRELMASPGRLGTPSREELACLHPVHHLGASDTVCDDYMAQAAALEAREAELAAELQPSKPLPGATELQRGESNSASEPAGDLPSDLSLEARLARHQQRCESEAAAMACRAEALALSTNEFADETRRMQTVLRRLGHLDEENVVQLKGRAAAELEACDELVAAELILGGVFNDLTAEAIVALCACLVAEQSERVKKAQPMHADLAPSFTALQGVAQRVAAVLNSSQIPTDEAEFVQRFDGGLVNLVYAWAKGATFASLTGMCDLFEGSIIRAIRRLSELLDELQSAAKAIGNEELFQQLEAGAKLIRRDIVFAGSLYIEA